MSLNPLRIFQHLLPKARAWRLTIDKQLRQFFEGLTILITNYTKYDDEVYEDLYPNTTRELDAWDSQFGLLNTGLTDAERRTRLDGAWKAQGGQSLDYIQTTLQNAGFQVFLHQWFVPGSEPVPGIKLCVTPRDPRDFLRPEFTGVTTIFEAVDGKVIMVDGNEEAFDGNTTEPVGYPLVNKILSTILDYEAVDGTIFMVDGNEEAFDGNFSGFLNVFKNYIVPSDPAKWPYFLYVGGETFPDIATILPSRRDEFETLLLKLGPTQQWWGVLVQYL